MDSRVPALRSEALTQILFQIFSEDCHMLSHILERWGSLSCELKSAVLKVQGEVRHDFLFQAPKSSRLQSVGWMESCTSVCV